MQNENAEGRSLLPLTADIVRANISTKQVSTEDLCDMIARVHAALSSLNEGGGSMALPRDAQPRPAVPIEESVQQDFIICLEDGKKLKTLKRHLRARYQMSPEDYRAKWGLPLDYPMAAPNYINQRRIAAQNNGLGRRPAKTVSVATAPEMLEKAKITGRKERRKKSQ